MQARRTGIVHALIRFEELGIPAPRPAESAHEIDLKQASKDHVLTLESELRYTRENLQATIEELETSNEELQATNEELLASSEELQSSNEELHSVNEELYTVNGEYQKKIAELTEITTDMDNLLASTEIHTIFLDRNLCLRKFTPKIGETFNLLPQDLGRRIDGFTHSIEHPGLMDDIESVVQSGGLVERQLRDRNGNWFLMRVLPYRAGALMEGVVLTLVDVNSVKRAEAETRRKDEQLTAILRNSSHPVFILDRQGRYVLTDDSFKQVVGIDPTGKTVHEAFAPDVAGTLAADNQRVLNDGETVASEIVIRSASGPHTYLSVKFPLRDSDGGVTGVGGIMTDVTQLKQAERTARDAAVQRERFLAMLSHELRNPLAAILNALAVIAESGLESSAEWLDVIERRALHMARLLDDLLDVARVTQNKIEIRKQVFDLASTMDEVEEEIRPRLDKQQLTLTVTRPNAPLLVDGDPDRLQQIQVNLLTNAAKYTLPGGRVWYSVQREESAAVIRVRDTGVGLSADMLHRVFDLFVQGENAPSRTDRGIGVGLTLVKSIVELHGGTVSAASDGLGRGSEFVVRLPLASRALPVDSAPPALPANGNQESLRLLLVEDDRDLRETMVRLLEMDGYPVRAAANGLDALTAVKADCPDVALIDIGLPDLDGYEVARRLRGAYPPDRMKLVALTGYGQAADIRAAKAAGFDVHLTKPLKLRDLGRLLESLRRAEKNS